MKNSSLEHKTVRPGLLAYNFYSSDRHTVNQAPTVKVKVNRPSARHFSRGLLKLAIVIVLGLAIIVGLKDVIAQQSNNLAPHSGAHAVTSANVCTSNSQAQLIVVSISQRHLWACHNHKEMYDAPVVTGMENLVADKTPTGTYHIYAKQTNTTLTGADSTGHWSDPVSYWMPFLDNQYGAYGFHDATWRPTDAFGKIDPNSSNASHGCVEMPLAASKWLYEWAQVGTTVNIES